MASRIRMHRGSCLALSLLQDMVLRFATNDFATNDFAHQLHRILSVSSSVWVLKPSGVCEASGQEESLFSAALGTQRHLVACARYGMVAASTELWSSEQNCRCSRAEGGRIQAYEQNASWVHVSLPSCTCWLWLVLQSRRRV